MAKAKINAPTKDPFDPGYHLECEFALDPSFSKLIEEAVASGWPPRQVAYALMLMAARKLSDRSESDRFVTDSPLN